MKKTILIFFFVITLIGVYGCSNNNSNSNANTKDIPDDSQPQDNEVLNSQDQGLETEEEGIPMIEAGKKIPNFKMKTLAGDFIEPEDYEGKILMLNFWASWCVYCDQEMPDLDTIDKEEDVVVIAINAQEKQSVVQEYMDNGGYEFLTVLDEDGLFTNLFGVSSLPVTFFINEEGILIGAMPTMMTLEQMEQIVQDIRDDIL